MAVCRDAADAIIALRDPRRFASGLAVPGTAGIPAGLDTENLEARLDALGRHWLAGGQPDWTGIQPGERRRRLPLPTYPFERRRYWLDAPAVSPLLPSAATLPKESLERLYASLEGGQPRVEVSAQDLEALLALARSLGMANPRQPRTFHPRPALATPYAEPRSELELQLANLWQDLLGLEKVGADDNFFELGGHSLLATRLISQIRDQFGVDVRIARLFDVPTVTGLATEIVAMQATRIEEAALADLLAEIQGLSSEDLQQQLSLEKQSLREDGS